MTKVFSSFVMESDAGQGKEKTLMPDTGIGSAVKSASQLKNDAKRLEKLEKFKRKKAAQEAEKKNQTEVRA